MTDREEPIFQQTKARAMTTPSETPSEKPKPFEYQRVFRFTVEIDESLRLGKAGSFQSSDGSWRIGLSSIAWEGTCLVLSRGMRKHGPGLAAILKGRKFEMRVVLYNEDNTVFRRWALDYGGISDRGFDFLHASVDEIAMESVALLDAELTEVA